MAIDDGSIMLLPGAGKTVRLPGHEITFVHSRPDGAYSLVEWVSAPGVPGTPLHIHRMTDEAFYVLDGTFGFQVGERMVGDDAEAAMKVRKALSEKHDIEVVGPPRQAAD